MLKKLSNFIDSTDYQGNKQPQGKKENAKLGDSFDFLALIRSWSEIAGAKLSEHTIPLKNQNGTLVILSNHSAIANELSYMELLLKKKIIQKFPNLEKSILSIKFIVDSTTFDKHYQQFITPIKEKKNKELHPYSPEFRRLKKEAEEEFIDMTDLELKEKMISLYIQSFAK